MQREHCSTRAIRPLSVAVSSEPVFGKRQPQGQPFERPVPQARVPGNQRVHAETMTQVEELQSVKDAGIIGAYKFEVCPGTKRAGACKAASPNHCTTPRFGQTTHSVCLVWQTSSDVWGVGRPSSCS